MLRAISLVVVGVVSVAHGAEVDNWVASLRPWRDVQVRNTAGRLDAARTTMQRARDVMEPMVARSASEAYWRERLQFAVIDGELRAANPDVAKLDRAYRALFSNEEGMEYPQVAALRQGIAEFRDAAYFAALADPQASYREHLDAILALVPKYESTKRSADRVALGRHVAWLEQSRFVPALTESLYRRYAQPNELVQFHKSLVEKETNKRVEESKTKTYTIQGRPTPTSSTTTGQTYLRLIASEGTAEIEVGMTGTANSVSSSQAYERRTHVGVTTTATNAVSVYKRISIRGFSKDQVVVGPAVPDVRPLTSSSQISVKADPVMPRLPPFLQLGRRVRERVAPGMAAAQIPAGQREGLQIARMELADAANSKQIETPPEVANIVDQFQKLATEFIELVQRRSGVYPRRQWLATDENWIWMKHVRHTETELAAFGTPPTFQTPGHTIAIRLHESEVANTFNRQVAGQTYTDKQLEALNRSVLNYVPEELRVGSHSPRWTARFVDDDPMLVDFEKDRIELAIRFQEFHTTTGDEKKEWKEPFTVRAVYRVVKAKDGPMLKRLETATLSRTDGTTPLPEAMRAFIEPRMVAFFRDELYFDGLTPVRGGIFEPLTKFTFGELRTDDQWLLVGGTLDGDLLDILRATPSGLGGNERPVPGK